MDAASTHRIEGHGTDEEGWLGSPWMRQMPRARLPDLLEGIRRLVVVAPHPDDEVLGCGGLMMLATASGRELLVVSVSDGERCYPGDAFWTPARLRDARRRELRAALRELGLAEVEVAALGVQDGKIAASVGAVSDWLAREWGPGDLLLVTWAFDGHPDHEACHRAACLAANACGSPSMEYPVWGWHWAEPSAPELAMTRPMRLDLPSHVQAAKRRAIGRFATQIGECDPAIGVPVLPTHVRRRFERPFEVFFT